VNTEPVPFARPSIGAEEEEAVLRVLRSGWLTTGREALAFEEEFAAFLSGGAPIEALAVNSATSGLHLALEACGVGPGDIVLVPSYTFASTAAAARYLGAEAVFVDVTEAALLDPASLAERLDRLERGLPPYPPRPGEAGDGFGPAGRVRAVIPVHYGGLPCDMEAILGLCRPRGIAVIEDAAHAFPARLAGGGMAGTAGDAGVFSFYPTKPLTTGEGGMVVTGREDLAQRMTLMRSNGIDRTVWNRYTDPGASWYYQVLAPGFKYNMPDIAAALGRVQLRRAPALLARRKAIACRYNEGLEGLPGLSLPPFDPGGAFHLYPIRVQSRSRDEFVRALQGRGIGVSVHFIPLHTMPYYRERYGLREADLPRSWEIYRETVSLPIWPGMTEAQVERVIEAVRESVW
jgi:dTDP-4-amino-4,6-dideoxygalactose transaminase